MGYEFCYKQIFTFPILVPPTGFRTRQTSVRPRADKEPQSSVAAPWREERDAGPRVFSIPCIRSAIKHLEINALRITTKIPDDYAHFCILFLINFNFQYCNGQILRDL